MKMKKLFFAAFIASMPVAANAGQNPAPYCYLKIGGKPQPHFANETYFLGVSETIFVGHEQFNQTYWTDRVPYCTLEACQASLQQDTYEPQRPGNGGALKVRHFCSERVADEYVNGAIPWEDHTAHEGRAVSVPYGSSAPYEPESQVGLPTVSNIDAQGENYGPHKYWAADCPAGNPFTIVWNDEDEQLTIYPRRAEGEIRAYKGKREDSIGPDGKTKWFSVTASRPDQSRTLFVVFYGPDAEFMSMDKKTNARNGGKLYCNNVKGFDGNLE